MTKRAGSTSKNFPTPPPGYQLIRPLGRGAFKEVFEAIHIETNEHVAVKRYRVDSGNWIDPKDLTINFLDLRFHHRNLIPAYRISGSWIAEPLLHTVLSSHLPSDRRLTLDVLLAVADGLLQGLAFLHSSGLVHGDIKPQNMGLQSGVPVLCDFGTASILSKAHRTLRDYPGTIRTRPPELHARDIVPTAASDVWMMAASLLALVTSTYPFITEEQLARDGSRRLALQCTAVGIRRGETALHNRIFRTTQPRWLALLLCHALRFDPSKRITAMAFHQCLVQRQSAPDRVLSGWPNLRQAALKAHFQEEWFRVADRFVSFATTIYEADRLLEEYLLDGLSEENPFLSMQCYLALFYGLKTGRLNSRSPSLRRVTAVGSPAGIVLASLLLHMARPLEFSKHQVIEAFSSHVGKFGLLYNSYGKIAFHRATLRMFLSFLAHEKKELADKALTPAQILERTTHSWTSGP